MHAKGICQHLPLQKFQQLILDQVDNAIALFSFSGHLVLFNQKLACSWGLSSEWLRGKPSIQEVFTRAAAGSYLSQTQCAQFQSAFSTAEDKNISFSLEQLNGIHFEVDVIPIPESGHLFVMRDVTVKHQSRQEANLMQTSLNAEIKRLIFLQGLTERLQPASELWEIGKFALSYLVETMGAAFGDVKVISGEGEGASAGLLTNQLSTQFIACYGQVAVQEMEEVLKKGIPYGQGLLWQVVKTGEPLFIEDYKNHPQAVNAFRHPGIGSLGIFPIPSATGKIIGVLTLESRSEKKLQEAPQQDTLLAACRTLGVAIERAQAQEHLRRVNEDLERASQLKSAFLASMSHELRTPLNSILGFADLMQRGAGGDLTPRQLRHVQTIEKSGKHLLQLINDILDLSKIEAGKTELELAPINLQTLCHECLRMIEPRAEKKRLTLLLELDYRLKKVSLDERRVRQILINLLSNAVKFTPEGGKVKLSGHLAYGTRLQQELRPDRSPVNGNTPYLCLEVTDTGIGIPENKLHLLFRPFQQVDTSLTRSHEGTGLGLVLTKRLAELHGGTVSVESVENQGSTFRVWLPLTEMRFNLAPEMTEREAQRQDFSQLGDRSIAENTPRILVVEDQLFNQALISELLELEGYTVELVNDGQTMLELLNSPLVTPKTIPNLVMMDIQLPKIDGFELIRQLKALPLWQQVPVIAVTAMAMPGDRELCLEAGADAYLRKPLDVEKVNETVCSFLETKTRAKEKMTGMA